MGGVHHRVQHPALHPTPAVGGVAPVSMYPCRKAPRPTRGPDDEPRRAAPCLTDSSARSWSSAASVSRPPGRGPARFPRPIPWRCSSATTPPTCTAPPSRGTTSRPAWPRCWPGNFSSAHPGSGSPGWASVWGAGPAFRRGRFRLRPTGRRSSSARSITRELCPRGRRAAGHRRRRRPAPPRCSTGSCCRGCSSRGRTSDARLRPGAGSLSRSYSRRVHDRA